MGCIIQAITGNDGKSYTRQQLDACTRNGLRIQGYAWCFPRALSDDMKRRLAMFDGYQLERLWLDVEQVGLIKADLDRDLGLCDSYLGRAAGMYSGRWVFAMLGWLNIDWWANRELWDSNFTGIATVGSGFIPYGGWTWPEMTQFLGTSTVGSVHQVDLNIMAGE